MTFLRHPINDDHKAFLDDGKALGLDVYIFLDYKQADGPYVVGVNEWIGGAGPRDARFIKSLVRHSFETLEEAAIIGRHVLANIDIRPKHDRCPTWTAWGHVLKGHPRDEALELGGLNPEDYGPGWQKREDKKQRFEDAVRRIHAFKDDLDRLVETTCELDNNVSDDHDLAMLSMMRGRLMADYGSLRDMAEAILKQRKSQ
jgi:hypothetical protein